MNELLRSMAERFTIKHKPTVAFSFWMNGTVKQLNRDMITFLRAMLAEFKLTPVIGLVLSTSCLPFLTKHHVNLLERMMMARLKRH